MSRLLPATMAALLGALAGCGDPVADGEYLGEPLLRVSGRLEGDTRTSSIARPYIGIVWLAFDLYSAEQMGRVVTDLVPVPSARFPGEFHLDLYDRPPPEAFVESTGIRLALGGIVALDDVDGDRRFDFVPETGSVRGADRFFGLSFDQMLVYVERVDEPDCARAFWTNADELRPGEFQLGTMKACTAQFEVLPAGTPIRLVLFPPAATLPEEPPAYVDPGCDENLDCEEHPEDLVCRMLEAGLVCQEERCSAPIDAYDACLNAHCLEDPDFDACEKRHCTNEFAAMTACWSSGCAGANLCAYL